MSLFQPNPENEPDDYELKGESDDCWITVRDQYAREGYPALSVRVIRTDEGVVVDIWPYKREVEEPIATTYAFFTDAPPPDERY